MWGLRHIDDLVMRRQNNNHAGGSDTDYTDTGDRRADYFLTDPQFSVVAVIDRSSRLVQRVDYDAFGEARHHWAKDLDGDGDVDSADATLATAASGKRLYQSGYNPDADTNRDGQVNSTDTAGFGSGSYASALAAGLVGAVSSGYEEGYCGYRFDSEWLGYTVRFRHYDPAAGYGRWLERDPAGYRAGGSLYAYLGHAPTDSTDSFGLDEYIQRAGGPLQDVPGGRGDDGLFLESHWNPIIERRAEEARNAKPYVEELGWNLILTPLLEATGAVEKALGLAARELGWTAGRAWGAGGASAGFIVRAGSAGLDWVFNTKTGRWPSRRASGSSAGG